MLDQQFEVRDEGLARLDGQGRRQAVERPLPAAELEPGQGEVAQVVGVAPEGSQVPVPHPRMRAPADAQGAPHRARVGALDAGKDAEAQGARRGRRDGRRVEDHARIHVEARLRAMDHQPQGHEPRGGPDAGGLPARLEDDEAAVHEDTFTDLAPVHLDHAALVVSGRLAHQPLEDDRAVAVEGDLERLAAGPLLPDHQRIRSGLDPRRRLAPGPLGAGNGAPLRRHPVPRMQEAAR